MLYEVITILSDETQKMGRMLKLYSVGLRVAAILIIGLIITSIWFFQNPRSKVTAEMLQTVEIPYGARTSMTMPDGSQVWLNSGSTIKFANDFTKRREVSYNFV